MEALCEESVLVWWEYLFVSDTWWFEQPKSESSESVPKSTSPIFGLHVWFMLGHSLSAIRMAHDIDEMWWEETTAKTDF